MQSFRLLIGHICFCLCISILYIKVYEYSKDLEYYSVYKILSKLNLFENPEIKTNDTIGIYSSVFCRGNNHTNRLCHFKNLCYYSKSETFVFFHNSNSMLTGLPRNRFDPTLLDFSSVSDHNTQYFNYVEVPASSISKFNLSFITGHALVLKRFNPDNLMHVFHDDLLPIFTTLNEISVDDVFLVFADDRPPGPYAILYEKFLSKQHLYITSLSEECIHCFENIYIGLNKQSTWYQYGFKVPQGPLIKPFNEIFPIINNFRAYFLQQFMLYSDSKEEVAVLLVRQHNRKILNEKELIKTISDCIGLKSFAIGLEDMTILEVIQKIINARFLIGMHGSALILSLFLKPFSSVIELFPYGVDPNISTPFKTLCEIPGLHLFYKTWQNLISSKSISHPEYPPELGGINHMEIEEQTIIANSVVKPFLCCNDPVWLFRIYQDTIVDLDAFREILLEVKDNQQKLITNHSEESILDPSEVQNITCLVDLGENITLKFMWDEPWNVMFMNNPSNIEYEVWIQNVKTNDVQAYLMRKRTFSYSIKPGFWLYYMWVRCYVHSHVGPFNSSPFICTL